MAILKTKERRHFDINEKADIKAYSVYFKTGSWGSYGCPFILEENFTNVPDMCEYKIIAEFLKGK